MGDGGRSDGRAIPHGLCLSQAEADQSLPVSCVGQDGLPFNICVHGPAVDYSDVGALQPEQDLIPVSLPYVLQSEVTLTQKVSGFFPYTREDHVRELGFIR